MSSEHGEQQEFQRQARRFFAIGVSQAPSGVLAELHDSRPSRLAGQATSFVVQKALESRHFPDGIDQRLSGLFLHGIADTQDVIHPHLRTYLFGTSPDIERAQRFLAHPKTVGTIALLALRNEESMRAIIARSDNPYSADTALDPHDDALTMIGYGISPARHGGCPFAGSNGEIAPDPLFGRFIQWSGELCIGSIVRHHGLQ